MAGRPAPQPGPRRGSGVRDPIDLKIGAKVRELRVAHGFSQETLAKSLGLTFQQIQKYESGSNRISASMLIRICDRLGISAGLLLEGIARSKADSAGGAMTLQMARAARALAMIPREDVREAMFDLAKTIARADA